MTGETGAMQGAQGAGLILRRDADLTDVGIPREASVQGHAGGLEVKASDQAADELALIFFDIGKAPPGSRPAQFDRRREFAVPFPAPDRILRDAEALCDFLDGQIEITSI